MNTETYHMLRNLENLGFTFDEARQLRRISMTFHAWDEAECGNGNDYCSWSIERDADDYAVCTQCGETWYGESALTANCPKCGDPAPVRHKATGLPYHCVYPHNGKATRTRIPDREAGAQRRLDKIMANHPDFVAYHHGDCRGASLYIVRKSDLNGSDIRANYTKGVAVYK